MFFGEIDYLLPKPGDCPDAPPNNETPNGEGACVAAGGDPKEPKLGCVLVASEGWEPNPPNEKLVDCPDEFDCVLKPEKPLPNVDVPAVDVAVDVAGDVGLNPKALLPKLLVLDVGAVEETALNPPNSEPADIDGAAPNGVVLEVVVAVLKLLPNGDGDVAVVLLPNPPPNIPVLGAEVVAVLSALPKPLPNGLAGDVGEVPNILAVGADDVVVAGVEPNPLPKGLGIEDAGILNAPVLGVEVVAVVVIAVPNPAPNEVEVDAAEVAALPKNGPVGVVVAVPPNGRLEEVVGVKPNAVPPNIGFEPKPVDIIGFDVGEVDWRDVIAVEAGDGGVPKADCIDDGVEITGVTAVVTEDWLVTCAVDILGVFPKNVGAVTWFCVVFTIGWFEIDVIVVGEETVLLSNDRIALSPDIDCVLVRSVAVWTIGLFGWSLIDVSNENACVAGVAGVTEIVGIGELTDLAGVCKIFVDIIVVCNGLVVVIGVFEIVGVLLLDVILDFCVDDSGLVAIVFDNSCNCSGLVAPENKSIDVRTIRNIFLKLSDSIVEELVCLGVEGWVKGVLGLLISIVDCFGFCSFVDDKLITGVDGTRIWTTFGWVACKWDKISASDAWNDRVDDMVVLLNVELLNKSVFNLVQILSKSFSVSDTLWLNSKIRFWIRCFMVSFVFNEISKSGKKSLKKKTK